MLLNVFVLSLGLMCHLGVYCNIVRDMSLLCSREHAQNLILSSVVRSTLCQVRTILFGPVSSIWRIMQING